MLNHVEVPNWIHKKILKSKVGKALHKYAPWIEFKELGFAYDRESLIEIGSRAVANLPHALRERPDIFFGKPEQLRLALGAFLVGEHKSSRITTWRSHGWKTYLSHQDQNTITLDHKFVDVKKELYLTEGGELTMRLPVTYWPELLATAILYACKYHKLTTLQACVLEHAPEPNPSWIFNDAIRAQNISRARRWMQQGLPTDPLETRFSFDGDRRYVAYLEGKRLRFGVEGEPGDLTELITVHGKNALDFVRGCARQYAGSNAGQLVRGLEHIKV